MIIKKFFKIFFKNTSQKNIKEDKMISKTNQDKLLFNSLLKGISFKNISLPWPIDNKQNRLLIPHILGAEDFCVLSGEDFHTKNIDAYCLWGCTSNGYSQKIDTISKIRQKPLLRLEYGFISSYDIALNNSFQYSLIISGNDIYYNSSNSIQKNLLESNFEISQENILRVRNIINYIVKYGLTKYTLTLKTPQNEKKCNKKILLVDQRKGDNSIVFSHADKTNFQKMLDYALSLSDYEILVKIHPDATFGGKESSLLEFIDKKNKKITIINNNENPYSLFAGVEKVFVVCSQIGFEALMAGKEVHCFGNSFYSGYGLTIDHDILPKKKQRTLEEIFYVYYILFSRYYVPGIGNVQIEDLCKYIVFLKQHNLTPQSNNLQLSSFCMCNNQVSQTTNLKVCFVIAGGRWGATGRYIQYLAWYMKKRNVEVLVLCEGQCKEEYSGVQWRQIKFDNYFLSKSLKYEVMDFSPDIIYENGVRTIPQRAALELMVAIPSAKLVVQNEDDDLQVFQERYNDSDLDSITMLDKETISIDDIVSFLEKNNWKKTINILLNPNYDRWIDPILRILFYRMATMHTAIWYPLAKHIEQTFNIKTIIVPPVLSYDNISKLNNYKSKNDWLEKYKISPNDINIFLPGTIYNYSNEFSIFIDSLNIVRKIDNNCNIFLMTKGNTYAKKQITRLRNAHFRIIDLGKPSDIDYDDCLIFSDLICCPGINDRFNKMRLPSRLVKPMMLGKAIITFSTGFGESLENGTNCYLLQGDSAIEWAKTLEHILADKCHYDMIGHNAKSFAKQNFDAKIVSDRLIKEFISLKTLGENNE